jgi:hypothetical protein
MIAACATHNRGIIRMVRSRVVESFRPKPKPDLLLLKQYNAWVERGKGQSESSRSSVVVQELRNGVLQALASTPARSETCADWAVGCVAEELGKGRY